MRLLIWYDTQIEGILKIWHRLFNRTQNHRVATDTPQRLTGTRRERHSRAQSMRITCRCVDESDLMVKLREQVRGTHTGLETLSECLELVLNPPFCDAGGLHFRLYEHRALRCGVIE